MSYGAQNSDIGSPGDSRCELGAHSNHLLKQCLHLCVCIYENIGYLTDCSCSDVEVVGEPENIPIKYICGILVEKLFIWLVNVFLGISKRCQYTIPHCLVRNLLQLMFLMVVPMALGAPLRLTAASGSSGSGSVTGNVSNVVIIRSSVVGSVNITEYNRVCWLDADCVVLYPICKNRPSSCRCMSPGICVLLRKHGQKCTSDDSCEDTMHCVLAKNQNFDNEGPRITGVCSCVPRSRYNPFLRRCFKRSDEERSTGEDISRVSEFPHSGDENAIVREGLPSTRGAERYVPHFPDLPDPGGEDVNAPDEIPATYDGAILVGFLSLGLVILCLGLAMWCHYTSSRLRTQQLLHPQPQSHERLYASYASLHHTYGRPCSVPPDDKAAENIPLDMFIPPPEMYQTPGFRNYLSISDSVASTSRTEDYLNMSRAERSRTLR